MRSILFPLFAVAVAIGTSIAHAQNPNPAAPVEAVVTTLNAGDTDGALRQFADLAVVTSFAGSAQGRPAVRSYLERLVAGRAHLVPNGDRRVEGDRVTQTSLQYVDHLRDLGVAPAIVRQVFVVQDGRIASLVEELSPDTAAAVEAARARLAVIDAYQEAQRAGDVEALVALFAPGATGASAEGATWSGQAQIRQAMAENVAERVLSQRVRTQVIGDRVVSEVDVRSDRLEAAGLAPLRLTAETVIRDGLIHSARTEMAPPVAARVSEARNKGIVELLYRALSAHELTILDRLVRDDFVDQSPRPGFAANRDGLTAYQETLIEGMSNLRYRLDHTVAEGDLVVVRWTMSGTHDGDLFGLGPTRRQVSLTGTESFRLENWQIVERWANVDDADLIQQIGVGV